MAAGDFLGKRAAIGDVGNHHLGAFGGERLRIVPADALGAAGNDGGFSREPCHLHPLRKTMTSFGISVMKEKTEGGMEMPRDTADRLAIRDLVENWAVYRDARLWDRFRTVWHKEGRMMATWFQGTYEEFIKVSEEGYAKACASCIFSAAPPST